MVPKTIRRVAKDGTESRGNGAYAIWGERKEDLN